MAQVYLYNIQGFYGEHEYNLDDNLVIINSVNNGTGKTTLYDCIKFTCDQSLFDKEDRNFLLNLNAVKGIFSFTNSGVTHGFTVTKGQPFVFFKKVDGEELQTSADNFPGVAQDMGILMINDLILNVCGKDLNLFSSSGVAQNYQLVKTITTHQQTENALALLRYSIQENEKALSKIKVEKSTLDLQKSTMTWFLNIEELEELVTNESYMDLENVFDELTSRLKKLEYVSPLDFNSISVQYMSEIATEITGLQHTDYAKLEIQPLESLRTATERLETMQATSTKKINSRLLENLLQVSTFAQTLKASADTKNLSSTTLQSVKAVCDIINCLEETSSKSFEPVLLARLESVCLTLTDIQNNMELQETHTTQANQLRMEVVEHRVDCPIRKEVYLVDGLCSY